MNGRNNVWVLTPEDVIACAEDNQRYDKINLTLEQSFKVLRILNGRVRDMVWDIVDETIHEVVDKPYPNRVWEKR